MAPDVASAPPPTSRRRSPRVTPPRRRHGAGDFPLSAGEHVPRQAAFSVVRTDASHPSPLAGQVFRSLLRELPLEHSGGLADFDYVAVGVSHVAADLGTAIDRRRHELGPL